MYENGPLILQLLDACRLAFADGDSSPQQRSEAESCIVEILNRIQANDLGLTEGTKFSDIEYVEVAEFEQFTVGVFLVPKGRKLPLHDHPSMTVMSKVLFGTMAVTSFDKTDYSRGVRESDYRIPIETLLRTIQHQVRGEDPCEVLHATRDNLHEFHALEDVVILDVLAPPYDFDSGRTCTYYRPVAVGNARPLPPIDQKEQEEEVDGSAWPEIDLTGTSEGETVWLLARESPPDFYTTRREYSGPALDDFLAMFDLRS